MTYFHQAIKIKSLGVVKILLTTGSHHSSDEFDVSSPDLNSLFCNEEAIPSLFLKSNKGNTVLNCAFDFGTDRIATLLLNFIDNMLSPTQ